MAMKWFGFISQTENYLALIKLKVYIIEEKQGSCAASTMWFAVLYAFPASLNSATLATMLMLLAVDRSVSEIQTLLL